MVAHSVCRCTTFNSCWVTACTLQATSPVCCTCDPLCPLPFPPPPLPHEIVAVWGPLLPLAAGTDWVPLNAACLEAWCITIITANLEHGCTSPIPALWHPQEPHLTSCSSLSQGQGAAGWWQTCCEALATGSPAECSGVGALWELAERQEHGILWMTWWGVGRVSPPAPGQHISPEAADSAAVISACSIS